jgi:uncharacterized caspase-like protein
VFLILKVKSAPGVRFDGRGFFALSGPSQNPAGLSYGLQHPRAIVPLHTAFSATSGRFEIVPSTAGQLEIEWAVVERTACGELIHAQGTLQSVSIAPGSPRIVPRDEFGETKPLRRVQALQGDYELLEFKNRYEVYHKTSGELILKRQGRLPTFSPTGRFLSARPPLEETFEVIDLAARVVLGRYAAQMLAWSHGDSFLYVVGARQSHFWVVRTLHGRRDDVARAELPVKGLDDNDDTRDEANPSPPQLPGPDLEAHKPDGGLFGNAYEEWHLDLSTTDGTLIAVPINPHLLDEEEKKKPKDIVAFDLGVARPNQVVGSVTAVAGSETETIKKIERSIGLDQPKLSGWNVGEPLWLTDSIYREQWLRDGDRTEKEVRKMLDEQFEILRKAFAVRLDATAKVVKDIQPVSVASTRKASRVRATKLRGTGDLSYVTVIRLSLPLLQSKEIAGIRSGRDSKTMRQIGKEIAKLYAPDVATFKDDPNDRGAFTQGFVDPSIKPEKDEGPAEFNFANPGRDLWRFTIGTTTYWLTQTILAGRNAHGFDFTLLSSPSGGVPQFAGLGGQGQLGDMRGSLGAAFGAFSSVGLSGERYLTVATRPIPQIIAFDLQTWRPACAVANPIDGADIVTTIMHRDARHLTQINSDGAIHVYSCGDGKQVLSGAYVDDEVVLMSTDGYFEGTEDAAAFIDIAIAGLPGRHVLSQFTRQLRRPGIVKAVLEGKGGIAPPVLALPPLLKVAPPTANAGEVRIVAHSPGGLGYIQLYADGRPVQRVTGSGTVLEMTVPDVSRPDGPVLTAFAVDRTGIASAPLTLTRPPKTAQGKSGQLFSLAAGVDRYPLFPAECGGDRKSSCNLDRAVSDARRVTRALASSKLYARTTQAVLSDEKASRDAILASLDAFIGKAGAGDTIVAFFAAHGLIDSNGKLLIALASTSPGERTTTALAFEAVAERLRRAKARVVVLLDVCHAGLADRDRIATNDDAVAQLVTQTGSSMVVLAASKGRQYSEETTAEKGGRFSVAFEAVITRERQSHDLDGNGAISIHELYRGLKAKVVQGSGGKQTPWLSRNLLVGDFNLF